MQENTNNERRKILNDRLAEIKEKHNPEYRKNEETNGSILKKEPTERIIENKRKKSSPTKYVIVILLILGAGLYIFENTEKATPQEIIETPVKEEFVLKYNLDVQGHSIAIISSFEEESKAIDIKNIMKEKGFACDYFFLPDNSNSKEEIFQVFIGPYENMKETKQWTNNIDQEYDIIVL